MQIARHFFRRLRKHSRRSDCPSGGSESSVFPDFSPSGDSGKPHFPKNARSGSSGKGHSQKNVVPEIPEALFFAFFHLPEIPERQTFQNDSHRSLRRHSFSSDTPSGGSGTSVFPNLKPSGASGNKDFPKMTPSGASGETVFPVTFLPEFPEAFPREKPAQPQRPETGPPGALYPVDNFFSLFTHNFWLVQK